MLLKDCPVGSEVRLVSFCGVADYGLDFWKGTFVVLERDGVNCVKNGDGCIRDDVYNDEDFQFEIVSQPKPETHNKIYFKGEYYNLIPTSSSSFIEIDGVEYYMEPV